MSRIQDVISEYRRRLLDHERTALAALDFAHKQTLALIEPRLQALYDQMNNAMKGGEALSPSWLYESQRLQAIEQYITSAIDHYAALTKMQVESLQHMGAKLGQQAGMALLDSTVPMGVNFSFGIPSQQAIAGMVGATQKGSPLADLFNGFGAEAAQGAKNALISGVTLGYGPRQIAPSIQDALNISRNRALTIARNEANRTYRGANVESYRANSDVVDKMRRTCAFSIRTCAACIALDGTLYDLDEDPGFHVCDRCVLIPVTKSWEDILSPLGIDATGIEETNPALSMQTGQEWFDKQDEETQRKILGNAKYEAYADGQFTLKDVVGTSHDKDWGSSIYERSLKDTLEAAGSMPAVVQEAPKLSDLEQRLKDLEDKMSERHPGIVFDFAGAHPDVMEPAMKELDRLFQQFPEVAQTMPYVGTGQNITDEMKRLGYKPKDSSYASIASVANCYLPSMSTAYSPMFLNTKYFGDPAVFNDMMQHMSARLWFAAGSDTGGAGYIIAHEYGHAVNFFLLENGRNYSFMDFIGRTGDQGEVADAMKLFTDRNSALGNKISQYAQTNDLEKFAEAFASLQFAPTSEQATYTKRLGKFLDQVLDDGSSSNWTAPTPSQWTEDQMDAWDAFFKKYIRGQ